MIGAFKPHPVCKNSGVNAPTSEHGEYPEIAIQRMPKQAAKERHRPRWVELNLKIKQFEAKRTALLAQITQGV